MIGCDFGCNGMPLRVQVVFEVDMLSKGPDLLEKPCQFFFVIDLILVEEGGGVAVDPVGGVVDVLQRTLKFR
ncbi:hypothetical protein ES703_117076 [subsurface metagenome]